MVTVVVSRVFLDLRSFCQVVYVTTALILSVPFLYFRYHHPGRFASKKIIILLNIIIQEWSPLVSGSRSPLFLLGRGWGRGGGWPVAQLIQAYQQYGVVNYKKDALDSQPQVIQFTICLPIWSVVLSGCSGFFHH